jgi:two-component system sensor histidine kinase KdpD
MNSISVAPSTPKKSSYWLGGAIWLVGWVAIYTLDQHLDVNNLAMVLVLSSALAAMCLPWRISVLLTIVFVLVFDWFFIPPRGTFTVDLHQHALMLLVVLVVNLIVVSLMALLRAQSERALLHASEADILRQWSDLLLESSQPHDHLQELQELLAQLSGRHVTLLVLKDALPATDDLQAAQLLGDAGIEQRHALWYCTRNNQPLGRGTGRYEMFLDVYLPLRARGHALGAALLTNFAVHEFSTRVHLQAICDQFGNALERYNLHQQDIKAREAAQSQLVRNNLLAAISHDYRTPLATIMGAASSLNEQTEKLDAAQQQQLVRRIYDEAERLNTMTHNILQLARLDADNQLACDWQSAEEIVGELMRRWRGRQLGHRLYIKLDDALPLLWCDAVLIGQLLENLVDNALKYSPDNSPVIIHAAVSLQSEPKHFSISVSDKGQGIDSRWRDKIFEPFQRGPVVTEHGATSEERGAIAEDGKLILGAGVGLALCRAIARAHGGDIKVDCPTAGGSIFELCLPLRELPIELHNDEVLHKNLGTRQ